MANTDLVEWVLYDSDLVTRLSILPVISSHLYLELSEPGSGSLEIPLDSTAAGLVANGQLCMCYYRGSARGGFLVDNVKITDASNQEYSGRVLSVSGRGPLALLDEAIVWQDGSGTTTREYNSSTKAAVLTDQIGEAQGRGALSTLSYTFSSTADSTGTAWDDSDDLSFPVGTTLLDLSRQFYKSGTMEFDVSLSSSDFVLSAYKAGLGSDKTGTIIFRIGSNCMEVGSDERGDEIRNAMLVKYQSGYSFVSSTDSITNRRRREKLISLEAAQSADSANTYASAKLDNDKDPHKSISVQVFDGVGPRLFLDYTLGDTVTLDKMGTEVEFRILGIQVDFTGDDFATVVLEMNWIAREDDDLDWLLKQWNTAHDADLTEVKAWLGLGTPNDEVYALHYYGGNLYVGGAFTSVAGVSANYIAVYNTGTGAWSAMGAEVSSAVKAITDVAGTIYACSVDKVYRWDGTSWTLIGSTTGAAIINCAVTDGTYLYIGGSFTGAGAWTGGITIRDGVAKWTGGVWISLDNGSGITIEAVYGMAFVGTTLYIGRFGYGFLQYWNGSDWVDTFAVSGNILAVTEANGSLYWFEGNGGTFYLHRWTDPSTSEETVGTITDHVEEHGFSSLVGYLSDIYLGGEFKEVDGVTAFNNIAKYTGGVWSKLGTGFSVARPMGSTDPADYDDKINALAVGSAGDVYAGGLFTTAGGKQIYNLAVWVTDFQSLISHLANSSNYNLGAGIHGATATTTLTDNDEFPLWEDTSQALRKVTYAYLKSNLTTYNDGLYLRLDTSNDPLTAQLDVVPSSSGDGGIYVQTTGDAYTADIEQWTTNDNVSASTPALFVVQYTDGTGNIPSPAIQVVRQATGSGTITGDLLKCNIQGGAVLFQVLADGSVRLPQISDSDAGNDTMYYSSTASKLAYKDSGGTVHALY